MSRSDPIRGHYHIARPGNPEADDVDELDDVAEEEQPDAGKVLGYVTTMQYAAMKFAAEGKPTPGVSAAGQYHRLRRASIALGLHRPKVRSNARRRTRSITGHEDQI